MPDVPWQHSGQPLEFVKLAGEALFSLDGELSCLCYKQVAALAEPLETSELRYSGARSATR